MPSAKCAVNDCRNYLLHTTGISYHLLPAREDIKRRWEEALGRPLPPYARICSAHFKKADYTPSPACRKRIRKRLKSTAVPSVKCGKWTKIAHEIFRVPSVDITAIIDGLGANVEVGKPFCTSYLAPCTCASRQRAGTSEVVTQTQDDLKDMIANVSMLSKPYDEHSYASRWCSPTYAHASTQAKLTVHQPRNRDCGSQTESVTHYGYTKKRIVRARKKVLSDSNPPRTQCCHRTFGYTGRTVSSYGRRIGYPSRYGDAWPHKGCTCE